MNIKINDIVIGMKGWYHEPVVGKFIKKLDTDPLHPIVINKKIDDKTIELETNS